MLGERVAQLPPSARADGRGPRDEALALDDVEHGDGRRARRVVAGEREEHEPAAGERRGDVVAGGHRAERHVAAAEALAADDDVGLEREVLVAEVQPGAAEAGHHLVGDEQDVVAPADAR